ncbi:helix-turn-helix domain-containing protein [Pseudomonas sp. VEM90]
MRFRRKSRARLAPALAFANHDQVFALPYATSYKGNAERDARTMSDDQAELMTLKSSFATVLRAIRSKRNITQRQFADASSRTYLSKLEGGKSSITLDKLEQLSARLKLSPLTLLALTLSEDGCRPAKDLVNTLKFELETLEREGGLPGLISLQQATTLDSPLSLERGRAARLSKRPTTVSPSQTELAFPE